MAERIFDLAQLNTETGESLNIISADQKEDVYEALLEDDLKENVFGVNSNVSYEAFVENFGKDAQWCQSAKKI